MIVIIDTRQILDKESFHDVFASAFGFPSFYGRNMDAWIDCMSYLDQPSTSMTKVHCSVNSVVTLQLEYADDFALRQPKMFQSLLDCSGFVNWKKTQEGDSSVLALSYYK